MRLAHTALSELALDRVVFVPTYQTPLKKAGNALEPVERLRRLRSAVSKQTRFEVSDHEIRKKGISFTVDTLKYFKRKYSKNDVFYFLAGADVLKDLRRWRSFGQILNLCRFVILTRPGYSLKDAPTGVITLAMRALPISSTQIRDRAARGRSVGRLLPRERKKRKSV